MSIEGKVAYAITSMLVLPWVIWVSSTLIEMREKIAVVYERVDNRISKPIYKRAPEPNYLRGDE